MTFKKSGVLQYTARAFKQDSEDAMKGDVVRALIELVTNADDAYNSKGGSIQIRLLKSESPFQVKISVHDKATGLDADGLEKAFARLGDLNQKFVGDMGTRGLFGRGAKDVAALGKARFVSIKNGKFSSLEIDPVRATYSMEEIDEDPTKNQYEQCLLEAGENGLTAELFVSKVHRIPSAVEMIDKLQTHVQLRDLLNRNDCFYFDERSNVEVKLQGVQPSGVKLIERELTIPGYGKPVQMEVYKLESKQSSPVNEYSTHGLVISGRGAAYENSFLHLSKRPEVGWFCGRIDAPEIHDLARSIDVQDQANESNPTRIVSRQRDGLVPNHPYYRALASQVEKVLSPILDAMAEEEGAQRREGEKLRKRFDALSQILGNALQELLDEADAGEIPAVDDSEGATFTLEIIPPRKVIKVGDSVFLTIRVPADLDTDSVRIFLRNGKDNNFTLDGEVRNWKKHPRLSVLQGTVKITAHGLGANTLVANLDGLVSECEVISVLFEPTSEPEPTSIIFDPNHVKVAPTKTRNLILRGPLESVGEVVNLSFDSTLVTLPRSVKLGSSKSGKSAEIIIRAVAGTLTANVRIFANLNDQTAECSLEITENIKNKNPKIKIEVIGSENPPLRVDTIPEADRLLIRIFARHRSLTKIFGKSTESGFEFENHPKTGATIVEIVAQQLAIYAVERDAESHPDRYQDASSVLFKQQENIAKFVVLLQAGLLDE